MVGGSENGNFLLPLVLKVITEWCEGGQKPPNLDYVIHAKMVKGPLQACRRSVVGPLSGWLDKCKQVTKRQVMSVS